MSELKNYRPDQVSVIFGAIIIEGYADGTFVSVEHDEDSFNLHVGTDGVGTRTKNSNNSGTITVTLAQSSASNLLLSQSYIADRATPAGTSVKPLGVADKSGSSLHAAQNAWIQKDPTAEYSNEVTDRVWIFRTDSLNNQHGGN